MLRQAGANELKHTLIKAEPGSPGLNGGLCAYETREITQQIDTRTNATFTSEFKAYMEWDAYGRPFSFMKWSFAARIKTIVNRHCRKLFVQQERGKNRAHGQLRIFV